MLKLSLATRHPVFSSVKRVFRLPKGPPLVNILCKATPSEQDGLQRGRSSSVQRMAPLLHGEVTRPRPEASVPVPTVVEVPRGPKVPDTETVQARVEVSEDHEPLRPSAPNICPDSQDSPGLCAIHPGITLSSPSRPAHRGEMTTGKWTDGRGERGRCMTGPDTGHWTLDTGQDTGRTRDCSWAGGSTSAVLTSFPVAHVLFPQRENSASTAHPSTLDCPSAARTLLPKPSGLPFSCLDRTTGVHEQARREESW